MKVKNLKNNENLIYIYSGHLLTFSFKNANTPAKNVNKTLNFAHVARIRITYLEIMNALVLKNISIQVKNVNQ